MSVIGLNPDAIAIARALDPSEGRPGSRPVCTACRCWQDNIASGDR